jgi:hypothetical protein
MRRRSVAIVCACVLLAFASSASAQLLGGGIRQRLEGMRDRATLKDSEVHYDPSVLTVGNSRQQVVAAFGQPNATQGEGPSLEDVYAFYPDGSKFVDPQVTAGTIAAAVFTAGISLAARQAKIMIKEKQITCYRVHYDPNGNIQSVQIVPPEMGSEPAASPAPQPQY